MATNAIHGTATICVIDTVGALGDAMTIDAGVSVTVSSST